MSVRLLHLADLHIGYAPPRLGDRMERKNTMKIAVTATGPSLDDAVEPRFGRCPYFLIIDPDSLSFESVENPNAALGGGAGIQSAQSIAEKAAEVVP